MYLGNSNRDKSFPFIKSSYEDGGDDKNNDDDDDDGDGDGHRARVR